MTVRFQNLPTALLVLLSALVGRSFAALAGDAPPNLILIMADDLGYGDLSCYGSSKIHTPVLDRLASGGIRLTNFYAGATVCTPSRMALLTGAYPPRLGWKGGVLGYKMKMTSGLAPEARTMGEVFKDSGYRTALCGKWHLGSSPQLLPRNQGFDHSFFIKSSNNQTTELWRDDELVADPFDNRRLTEQFTREAIGFIRANREHPFFVYLPFTAPHFPAQAHPDWKGKSRNGAYGDVVEELDARIGEILETLKETQLEKRTLVVFLSDNGPEPGQKEFATAAPCRGLKWSSLEGGTRVPCIVSWPGIVPPAQVRDELVAAIDLLPTLAHACGVPVGPANGSPAIDGLDLWESLLRRGKEITHPRKDLLYWSGWAVPQAIRVGDWKLYFDAVDGVAGSDSGPALFHLDADLSEERNLSAAHPEKVAEMLALARKKLDAITAASIPLGGSPAASPDPKTPRWLK
jgi:arylsulfatase A-like enzyme